MDKQHVLIIDDDKDIAHLFQMVLDMVGFDCDVVYSAREGLSRLSLSIPDIILLDLRLGLEIGGEDILYQIRSNPRFKNTRVVVITGYPTQAEPIADLTDLVLLKPVALDQLKTLVKRLASTETKPKTDYYRDPVTGLFNREFFYTRLEHAFERKKREDEFIYAVLVFTAKFEPVLDGEIATHIFDELIREVSWRLVKNFRPTDTLARLTSHKFASLHEGLKRFGDVGIITDRLSTELLRPYDVASVAYRLTLTIGAALYEYHFQAPGDILEAAEANLKTLPDIEESSE